LTDHLLVVAPFWVGENKVMVRKWSLSHLSINSSTEI